MASALTAEEVQLHSDNLASTTNFRVFPVLVETALYGASSGSYRSRSVPVINPPPAIFTILIITSSYILM